MRDPDRLSKNLKVPTLPTVVARLGRMVLDPEVGPAEVGAVIEEDPPLAGRVLRIANSSFYGLSEPCTSVGHACAMLGLRMIHGIVLQTSVIKQYDHLRNLGFDIEQLWRHSILVGRVAAMLSKRSRAPGILQGSEAYLTGLLHDVGQVVLLDNLRAEYLDILRRAKERGLAMFVAEREELGTTHAELGATAAAFWGLPTRIVHAVRVHHSSRTDDLSSPAACLVIKSDALVYRVAEGRLGAAEELLDAASAATLGITPPQFRDAIAFVEANLATPASEAA